MSGKRTNSFVGVIFVLQWQIVSDFQEEINHETLEFHPETQGRVRRPQSIHQE